MIEQVVFKVLLIHLDQQINYNPPLQDSPPPQEELQNRFYSIRGQSSETECWDHAAAEADLSLYAGDVNFQYVDFAKRQDESATFRIQDFTWDEEGYSTIARSAVHNIYTTGHLSVKKGTIYSVIYLYILVFFK